MITRLGVALSLLLALPSVGQSHQLDEYLQAARLDITRHRVALHLTLTPGVTVATRVMTFIDSNADGEFSSSECDAYAREVLNDLLMEIDGQPQPLTLLNHRCSAPSELVTGFGTISIAADVNISPAAFGHHQLRLRNDHATEIGVYLVNVLIPEARDIEIAEQQRDPLQREFRVGYTVTSSLLPRLSLVGFALGLTLLAGYRSSAFAKASARLRSSSLRLRRDFV